jgi:hypothetical protein
MDKSPSEESNSTIVTLPPIEISPRYRRRPIYLGQMGKAISYIANDNDIFTTCVRPSTEQLALWDSATRKEPIIFDGLQKMTLAIKAKLGTYTHPTHPEITKFVRANTKRLKKWIGDAAHMALWSGSATGEIVHERRKGPNGEWQVWVKDIVFYHPLDPLFIVNQNGALTHGEKLINSPFLTGVWVPCSQSLINRGRSLGPSFSGSHVRLPKTKVFHTTLNGQSNNPYGISQLEAAIKYHIYKEAFLEMQGAALDRYGTPLIYAVVPMQPTKDDIEEPDGTTRKKWYHELATELLSDLRGQQSIVLTQMDKDHPVKLETLTTGNNFSDAFNQAIDLCDDNIMIAMGIPNLILKDKNQGLGTGGAAERQMEAYHMFIGEIYETITDAILEQVISPLILWNFDYQVYTEAYDPGGFGSKAIRTSENAVQATYIEKLVNMGIVDPTDSRDRDWVRDLFNAPITRDE